MALKVTVGTASENPFYGLRSCLELFNNGAKSIISEQLLNNCWAEVRDNGDRKKMFFSLLFSIGDITARQHNIFGKEQKESGGHAARDNFRLIMKWLKKTNYAQFIRFMFARLFNEYTSFDNLLMMRIKTKPKTKLIVEKLNMVEGNKDLASYLAIIIKGNNPFDKFLVAKFLTRPRLSKRQNHKVMLDETKVIMLERQKLIKEVSDLMGWNYEQKSGYINFIDFYAWKKQWSMGLESALFASKKIKEFDETEFKLWIQKLPSSARFRVRKRILTKENVERPKWSPLGSWFLQWENYKEVKQTEQRVIEEKVRQGTASEDDQVKLKEVKKEAKVNVGAVNFTELFKQIIMNEADEIKIQPFLDKIKLSYNTLVFVDDSGSMQQSNARSSHGFTAYDFAAFIATICVMKNPDDIARNMIALFSQQTRVFNGITAVSTAPNSLMKGVAKEVNLPFYNPDLKFTENLHNMRAFLHAQRTGNGTNISSIPEYLHMWTKGDQNLIEQLQAFPVWTIITDGNWNNLHSAEASMNDFMRKCEMYFGFAPFVIAIDVSTNSVNIDRFRGIKNFMFLPPNPAQIEQFLTNFKDIEVMDVYTPLLSLFRTDRYELVRQNTLV